MVTTGGFSSKQLLDEEQILRLASLSNSDAVEIGEIATQMGKARNLPITVEVRIGEWIVYHASLEGSKPENDWWKRPENILVYDFPDACSFRPYCATISGNH
jgi:uncharacterized protein (UPF0303 family)